MSFPSKMGKRGEANGFVVYSMTGGGDNEEEEAVGWGCGAAAVGGEACGSGASASCWEAPRLHVFSDHRRPRERGGRGTAEAE